MQMTSEQTQTVYHALLKNAAFKIDAFDHLYKGWSNCDKLQDFIDGEDLKVLYADKNVVVITLTDPTFDYVENPSTRLLVITCKNEQVIFISDNADDKTRNGTKET